MAVGLLSAGVVMPVMIADQGGASYPFAFSNPAAICTNFWDMTRVIDSRTGTRYDTRDEAATENQD